MKCVLARSVFGRLSAVCDSEKAEAERFPGVLLGISGGSVPPGSPNPDPISAQNIMCHVPYLFSDLASKIHTRSDLASKIHTRSDLTYMFTKTLIMSPSLRFGYFSFSLIHGVDLESPEMGERRNYHLQKYQCSFHFKVMKLGNAE